MLVPCLVERGADAAPSASVEDGRTAAGSGSAIAGSGSEKGGAGGNIAFVELMLACIGASPKLSGLLANSAGS